MNRHARTDRGAPRRRATGRNERGAALVEFSLIASLVVLLVMAIITYGVLLSYRQVLTQSASDGARAAAIAVDDPDTVGDERIEAARAALDASLDAYDRSCEMAGDKGLTCTISIDPCVDDVTLTCVTVELSHDQRNHPLVATMAPLNQLTPSTLNVSTIAIVSGTS